MILPAVRERLERLLRLPAMEGTLAELRSNANLVSLSGLHEVAKALVAAYLSHELRRPAFFITDSNRRAESLADSLRFFFRYFPAILAGLPSSPLSIASPGTRNLPMPTFWNDAPPRSTALPMARSL